MLAGSRSWFRSCLRLALPILVALCTLAPSPAAAQAVYGSISGTVTDSSGAVLPGVSVTVTSVDRKTTDTVVTNESGFFLKERLVPGTYEVKAELASFKTAVVPSVVVNVDAQTPINFKLEVGELTETVTVTGGSPLLKTDRADVATSFSQKQLTELPILDRNFTKFILLTPGTQQLGWQHAASENPQGSVQTMVNGQNFSGTGYQLDGTENRDPILGIIVINPNLDAIGESKITSQNYDAEFGQATAGIVSVQTKSGTNDWHGSAFEFWQGDKFQARNPFSQALPNPQTGRFIPETSKHQFGGTFGGRIIENRTFFFGAYQGQRQTQGGSRLLTVPTAAARAGDLSAYGVNIFDPATGATPGEPDAVWRQRHPNGTTLAAGAGPARADSDAQRPGRRERHARELHRQRQRDLRRRPVRRPHGSPRGQQLQPVRALHACQLPARRPDGVRRGRRPRVS